MKLTLNISTCPNDTFMFDALINGRINTEGIYFDVRMGDIEELNYRALTSAKDMEYGSSADIASIIKISYAILPVLMPYYRLLDSGSALGYENGPQFVTRAGVTMDSIRKVAIPGKHTTANMLMQNLFPGICDKPSYLFSEIADVVCRGECDAGVLIHEERFTFSERGLESIADLGFEWEQLTGLPLPLGGIVVAGNMDKDLQIKIERLIHNSVKYAMDNPEMSRNFVKKHAQNMSDHVIDQHIKMFVTEYSLSLGENGRKAVCRLLNKKDVFI